MKQAARYPGIRVTANGNQLVSYHTETRIADAGVFYPITPSTEGGELFGQRQPRLVLDVEEDHPRTLPREVAHNGFADPCGPARDHNYPVFQTRVLRKPRITF